MTWPVSVSLPLCAPHVCCSFLYVRLEMAVECGMWMMWMMFSVDAGWMRRGSAECNAESFSSLSGISACVCSSVKHVRVSVPLCVFTDRSAVCGPARRV